MALRSVNDVDSATAVQIPLDVRGWEVRTALDNERVGSVHDVLVDERGAARYLDIDLGMLRKHVLLPIGQAATHERNNVIWVQAMERAGFDTIPGYGHHPEDVSSDFEWGLAASYDRTTRMRYHRPEYGGMGVSAFSGRTPDPTVLGTEQVRLRRLSELSAYEVADDDPDPRGWILVDAAGEPLGEVEDLVVDPQALKARYLEVELARDVTHDRSSEHVLIPVGYARLDEAGRRVRVAALNRADAATLPRFADVFDDAYEERIDRHFLQRFQGPALYGHPRYDADRLYATRTELRAYSTREPAMDRICDVRLRH